MTRPGDGADDWSAGHRRDDDGAVRPRDSSSAARLLLATAALVMACTLAPGAVVAAGAQDEPAPTPTTSEAPDSPGIIPEPNSGSEPEDAGDRGGGLQTLVFVIVVAGVGVMGWFIVRESRRARARRGF